MHSLLQKVVLDVSLPFSLQTGGFASNLLPLLYLVHLMTSCEILLVFCLFEKGSHCVFLACLFVEAGSY